MKIIAALAGVFAAGIAFAAPVAAQGSYPSKAITIIVPATPGGAIDTIARLVGDKLQTSMGQPVVVENKPGGSSTIGTDLAAKAAPDGYTLVIVGGGHVINKFTIKDLPYDPVASFAPVAFTHIVPLVVTVAPDVPANNIEELIAWIKANPGTTYASTGRGTIQQLATAMFMSATGTKMTEVPYKGSTAAHPDIMAGRVPMIFDPISAVLPQIKSGGMKGLAVTTLVRSPSAPDLPTVDESGVKGYTAVSSGGILAPAGTPKEIVDKLNEEINKALVSDDVKSKMEAAGMIPQSGTPENYAEFIQSQVEIWGKVTADLGIVPE